MKTLAAHKKIFSVMSLTLVVTLARAADTPTNSATPSQSTASQDSVAPAGDTLSQSPDPNTQPPTSEGANEKTDAPPEGKRPPSSAKKTVWTAQLMPNPNKERITTLNIFGPRLPVVLMPKDKKLRPLVEVRGRFERPDWELYVQTSIGIKKVAIHSGAFSVFAYLNARFSDVTFLAKGPNNATESEKVILFAPEAQEYRIGAYWGEFLFSVGAGSFHYFQTGFGDFASKNAVQSVTYNSPAFASRWGATALVRAPVWTVASAPIKANPTLLEAKAGATYIPINPTGPWKTTVIAGVNYLTLISNGATFGFHNLITADLGFQVVYTWSDNKDIIVGMNYDPISGFLGAQRGYDFKGGYKYRLNNLHHIQADLIYSNFKYVPVKNAQVKTRLLALMVGYTF